jgi:Calx-beta domain
VPVFALLPRAPTGPLTTTFTISGVPVPHCSYDETSYVNADPSAQDLARNVMAARHQVIIVPRQPLTQGASYGASISTTYAGDSMPTLTEWSFTTGSLPEVSVGNASIVEGHAKTRSVRVTVTLSKPSSTPITVQYATVAGSATAPSDYSTKVGTVTIPANGTSTVISIPVKGDRLVEPNETFAVQLSNPQGGAILGRSTGSVQIRTDDKAGQISNAVRLSIGNASVVEGKTAARQVRFNISLSTSATVPVKVSYATAPATADASDFTAKAGTITIPPGTTSVIVSISVKADTTAEVNEQFSVKLSSPTGASIQFGSGTGSILNDDAL